MSRQEDYLKLLDLAYHVADSLGGKAAPDHRIRDCNQLAAKLFFHAATVYWLRQGTKAPVPQPHGAHFYDLASVAVIVRAALETYLTMFEVFFEAVTDDEREFRHALWQLSGFVIREGLHPFDPTHQRRIAECQHSIQELRSRVERTEKYASLSKRQKRECLKGRAPSRPFNKRLEAVGFAPEFTRSLHRYLSGHVHSDGLSAAQVAQAETRDDQVRLIDGIMPIIMIAMAKMILQYRKMFPSAEAWCLAKPEAVLLAEDLSDVALHLD